MEIYEFEDLLVVRSLQNLSELKNICADAIKGALLYTLRYIPGAPATLDPETLLRVMGKVREGLKRLKEAGYL